MRLNLGSILDANLAREVAMHLSAEDFAQWWVEDMIYVRPFPTHKGVRFAAYAADGTFVEMFDSLGEVIIAAHAQSMDLATVH